MIYIIIQQIIISVNLANVSKNLNPKKRFYDNNPKDYNFYEVKIDNKKDQLIYNFDDNLTLQIKIKISNVLFIIACYTPNKI